MIGYRDYAHIMEAHRHLLREVPSFNCDWCGNDRDLKQAVKRNGDTYCNACACCRKCDWELERLGSELCADCAEGA
jgi:hypothetical protein